LVIVRGAAHSIQSREPCDQGRKALFAFLLARGVPQLAEGSPGQQLDVDR